MRSLFLFCGFDGKNNSECFEGGPMDGETEKKKPEKICVGEKNKLTPLKLLT